MDSKIFGNIGTYLDVYSCLSELPLSREGLTKNLKATGRIASSTSEYVRKAADGELAFIQESNGKIALNMDELLKFLSELCKELHLDAQIQMQKKGKKEDSIATVLHGHSPQFHNMNNELNAAKQEVKKLREEKAELESVIQALQEEKLQEVVAAINKEMSRKVLVPASVESVPKNIFARDFFYSNPSRELDPQKLVSKQGGILDEIYQYEEAQTPELTEENYWKRICARFASGEMFRRRLADEEKLQKQRNMPKEKLDENRLKSINLLLADEEMDNQTKLSTYAFWYFHDDPEMEELLNFAGEHGIYANYVIGLLEKPAKLRNYRTMRAFLMQAQMASEARIKREAAKELMCGEWSIVADYCGKPCHFKMFPVEELELFRKLLEENKPTKSLTVLKKMLKSTSGPVDQKLMDSKKTKAAVQKKEPEKEESEKEESDIKAPDFIREAEAGADVHTKVDDEAGYEGFSEYESEDGKGAKD